jgi:hypothetical protein
VQISFLIPRPWRLSLFQSHVLVLIGKMCEWYGLSETGSIVMRHDRMFERIAFAGKEHHMALPDFVGYQWMLSYDVVNG